MSLGEFQRLALLFTSVKKQQQNPLCLGMNAWIKHSTDLHRSKISNTTIVHRTHLSHLDSLRPSPPTTGTYPHPSPSWPLTARLQWKADSRTLSINPWALCCCLFHTDIIQRHRLLLCQRQLSTISNTRATPIASLERIRLRDWHHRASSHCCHRLPRIRRCYHLAFHFFITA